MGRKTNRNPKELNSSLISLHFSWSATGRDAHCVEKNQRTQDPSPRRFAPRDSDQQREASGTLLPDGSLCCAGRLPGGQVHARDPAPRRLLNEYYRGN